MKSLDNGILKIAKDKLEEVRSLFSREKETFDELVCHQKSLKRSLSIAVKEEVDPLLTLLNNKLEAGVLDMVRKELSSRVSVSNRKSIDVLRQGDTQKEVHLNKSKIKDQFQVMTDARSIYHEIHNEVNTYEYKKNKV